MKREYLIKVVALSHATYLILNGVWPLVDIRSYHSVAGPSTDRTLFAVAGLMITVAISLYWSVHRGLVDPPVRLVALGTGGTLGLTAMVTALSGDAGMIQLINGVVQLMFAVSWAGILMTSSSPYIPRPVSKAKRKRQNAEDEGPGWWK